MKFTKGILIFALSVTLASLAFSRSVSPVRQKFITCALSFVETPYVWGGDTPNGFDCSGFVGYVSEHSIRARFPRTAHEMSLKLPPIKKEQREPGDIVFFRESPNARVTHVGIYCGVYRGPIKEFVGKRVFISAVSGGSNRGVKLSLIDEGYWAKRYPTYGRVLLSTDEYNKKHMAAVKSGAKK
ncbi:MAG: C40 family peptidase [Treponema sp.]|nr:C40 family peptidase [Treponema sp.]